MMRVSIIIPTYNASPYLTQLIPALREQTIAYELIIIDSSSTDSTVAQLKPIANKILTIPQSQFDHGGTRTIAAKAASGEILIFLTQDALPVDCYSFENLLKAFESPHVAVAYGRQLAYEQTNIFGKHLRAFNYGDTSYIRTLENKEKYGMKTIFLSDSFAAYRKKAMQEVEYFKDNLIAGEDNHITAKLLLAGYSIAYHADAQVYHSHSYSPYVEFQRYFDIGVYHTCEHWILEQFGKAEGEGGRYVKSELYYLLSHHAYLRLPEFILRNGLKYIGYKLGQQYTKLPRSWVKKLSMHTSWWDK